MSLADLKKSSSTKGVGKARMVLREQQPWEGADPHLTDRSGSETSPVREGWPSRWMGAESSDQQDTVGKVSRQDSYPSYKNLLDDSSRSLSILKVSRTGVNDPWILWLRNAGAEAVGRPSGMAKLKDKLLRVPGAQARHRPSPPRLPAADGDAVLLITEPGRQWLAQGSGSLRGTWKNAGCHRERSVATRGRASPGPHGVCLTNSW